MTKDEALKLALEALESCNWVDDGGYGHAEYDHVLTNKAITAIREALAQPEQETVAYQDIAEKCRLETVPAKGTLLHTSPPASKSWQALTGEGIDKHADMHRKE
jgi:hypothetical protein